jgi:serine/threonine-protein kinase
MSDISGASDSHALPRALFGYDIIDFLGTGAGSRIYAVSDPATRQIYALKHVTVGDEKQHRFFEQLEAEYEVGRQINHTNVRRVIDLKVNRTLLRRVTDAALVMELFDGLALDNRAQMTLDETLHTFIQTAAGIGALHARRIVHCDLKPNNILVGPDGKVKVIDLGQGCLIGTVKKRIQGTPDYISPEQVKCQPVTVRTDIFNFGATMYWALTRQHVPTLYRIKKSDNSILADTHIQSPAQINPAIPTNLSNLVMECVRTNPVRRPGDIARVGAQLEAFRFSLQNRQNGIATIQLPMADIVDEPSDDIDLSELPGHGANGADIDLSDALEGEGDLPLHPLQDQNGDPSVSA